MKYDYETLTE